MRIRNKEQLRKQTMTLKELRKQSGRSAADNEI